MRGVARVLSRGSGEPSKVQAGGQGPGFELSVGADKGFGIASRVASDTPAVPGGVAGVSGKEGRSHAAPMQSAIPSGPYRESPYARKALRHLHFKTCVCKPRSTADTAP